MCKAAYVCMAIDMDGLKGLPEAIKTTYLKVNIKFCIIYQIRNSLKYIASKDKKEFMKDLKCVYIAVTEESAIYTHFRFIS